MTTRTKLSTHYKSELAYLIAEKHWGYTTGSLKSWKRAAHREDRRNAKALISEQLNEQGVTL